MTPDGVLDTSTGELSNELSLAMLASAPGGVIAGRNLYGALAPVANEATGSDAGWSVKVNAQEQRTDTRVGGVIYISHITYRPPKRSHRLNGVRTYTRTGTIKWLVLNLELFSESVDVVDAAESLLKLADLRGVSPRHSPGALGSALLRSSPSWKKLRRPAPHFISDAAREHLPGNYYAIRPGYRKAKRAYYLDQTSAHHTIAATTPMPHPHYLRARGRFRTVENGSNAECYRNPSTLDDHIGVIIAQVRCPPIHHSVQHLYPQWMRTPGKHMRWIWTPELRLLGDVVKIEYVSAALTSIKADPALAEYARWCLDRLSEPHDPAIKPAMLAAYGMLAIRTPDEIISYAAHGRQQAPRSERVTLPLLERVYRSKVGRRRVPSIQNVVARGVIESEVRTRSIEYARRLEDEGTPVVHIYADGVIAACDQLPFTPAGWRVAGTLTDAYSPAPHSIVSREMVRLPGVPNGRRTAYMRPDADGLHLREYEPRLTSA